MPSSLEADRALLSELMAMETTSGGCTDLALDVMADRLDDAGCVVHRLDGPAQGRGNLIALAGPAGADGGLCLSGHIDTVPVGSGWNSDPMTLTERDGRWYGRGSCDMTGFVAMATNLLIESHSLQAPLSLIVTADEELGSLGAASLVEQEALLPALPPSCVVGEPTSLRVVRLHKGHLKFTVHVHGATGHTGTPKSGVNAIDGLRRVLDVIDQQQARLSSCMTEESSSFSKVPSPVLAPVRLHAGQAWNVIPDRASVDCGLRVLPDQDPAHCLAEIQAALEEAMTSWPLPWSIEVKNDNPPMCTPRGADIEVACRALVGQEQDIGVSYCSDGGHLARLGMECVLFGPGDIAVAHRPDEFVPISEIEQSRAYLSRLIAARCGAEA